MGRAWGPVVRTQGERESRKAGGLAFWAKFQLGASGFLPQSPNMSNGHRHWPLRASFTGTLPLPVSSQQLERLPNSQEASLTVHAGHVVWTLEPSRQAGRECLLSRLVLRHLAVRTLARTDPTEVPEGVSRTWPAPSVCSRNHPVLLNVNRPSIFRRPPDSKEKESWFSGLQTPARLPSPELRSFHSAPGPLYMLFPWLQCS